MTVSLAACGGGTNAMIDSHVGSGSDAATGGGNHVEGTVNGMSFNAKEAISSQFDHTGGFSFVGPVSIVELTDYANSCALAAQKTAPTGSLILDLAVGVNDASGNSTAPTAPGTFTVYSDANPLPPSTNVAQVYLGSGCGKTLAYGGISGTVTLTTVKPDGSLSGTFDVTISCAGFSGCTGGDAHLTGSFASTVCQSLNVNSTPTCT